MSSVFILSTSEPPPLPPPPPPPPPQLPPPPKPINTIFFSQWCYKLMPLPASRSCICRVLEVCFTFLLQVYAIFCYLLTCLNPLAKPDVLFGYALSLKFLKLLFFNQNILPRTLYFVSAVSNFVFSLSLSLSLSLTPHARLNHIRGLEL